MGSKDWTGNGNSIFKTLGASNHTDEERETDDFYATEPKAIDILLEYPRIQLPHGIWESSCGSGCLSKRLEERGHYVVSTDLVDRGFGTGGVNFFDQERMPEGCTAIVTNPPYKYATEYVLQCTERILCAKNAEFEFMEAHGGSAVSYAWWIWRKGYKGDTTLDWINHPKAQYVEQLELF